MKYGFMFLMLLASVQLNAQETYDNAKLMENNSLSGTARYVSMGGAMEALGGDLSTMSTNPAGIGLFRHSTVTGTFGGVFQDRKNSNDFGKSSHVSFDQLGFVYVLPSSYNSNINFGVNYRKSKNFNQILSVVGTLDNASQNKLTYEKYRNEVFSNFSDPTCTQLDQLYLDNMLYNKSDDTYYNYLANNYIFNQNSSGYIGDYSFNLSGNFRDRLYLGFTIGYHDVHYKHHSEYSENLRANAENFQNIGYEDYRRITGSGIDFKIGAIFRPIDNSPFRIGLSVSSPIWYDLTTTNLLTSISKNAELNGHTYGNDYNFQIITPWKFGVSVGHTVGNYLALGVSYEYADYSTIDSRIKDDVGIYDSWYGDYYESSSTDRVMNNNTKQSLKGVSLLKLGLEYKPTNNFAIRLGYNNESAMYKKTSIKDGTVWSPGTYYSPETNYVNWGGLNRFTTGFGYDLGRFNVSVAYQYTIQKGDYYPFMSYYDRDNVQEDNIATGVKVENKHHQLFLSVGYRF